MFRSSNKDGTNGSDPRSPSAGNSPHHHLREDVAAAPGAAAAASGPPSRGARGDDGVDVTGTEGPSTLTPSSSVEGDGGASPPIPSPSLVASDRRPGSSWDELDVDEALTKLQSQRHQASIQLLHPGDGNYGDESEGAGTVEEEVTRGGRGGDGRRPEVEDLNLTERTTDGDEDDGGAEIVVRGVGGKPRRGIGGASRKVAAGSGTDRPTAPVSLPGAYRAAPRRPLVPAYDPDQLDLSSDLTFRPSEAGAAESPAAGGRVQGGGASSGMTTEQLPLHLPDQTVQEIIVVDASVVDSGRKLLSGSTASIANASSNRLNDASASKLLQQSGTSTAVATSGTAPSSSLTRSNGSGASKPPLVHAEPVRRRRRTAWHAALLLGLLAAIATVLALTLTLPRGKSSGGNSSNKGSSDSGGGGTAAPTSAPTVGLAPEFRAQLPDFTQQALGADSKETPQALAFDWVASHPIPGLNNDNASAVVARMEQRMALATLYYATRGDASWKPCEACCDACHSWLNASESECKWVGVACTNQKVKALRLNGKRLSGTLPPELALLRSTLKSFDVQENAITGTLPTLLGSLTNLATISVYSNQLTGRVPTELGRLTQLTVLDLMHNSLTQTLPTELGQLEMLRRIIVADNQLTGAVPPGVWALSRLNWLNLPGNQLSSTLPTELAQLTELGCLHLSTNRFTGVLPTQLGLLSRLTFLSVGSNQWNGTVPSELGSLTGLTSLRIFDTEWLTGTIPWASLQNLTQLTDLLLFGNRALDAAPLPAAHFAAFQRLQWMYLSNGTWTGTLPTELAQLTDLRNVSLSGNGLNGTLPTELGLLTNLEYLYLNDNRFTGTIPAELASLSSLKLLWLQGNDLSGSVPTDVCRMVSEARANFTIDCDKVECDPMACGCSC